MCGIVGILATGDSDPDARVALAEALRRLRHRGPDDHGIWTGDGGVGLGHARLSILDLSESGHQPMVSPDGRHVIVFNGEIYNFGAIRSRLLQSGHTFVGSGDTEVILHAFSEWGPEAVHEFLGMFAFAIWDRREKRLDIFRDRLGVKPLYYGWDGRTFCFASELKALRAFRHWAPTIDRRSLGEFLQYGYVSGARSIYANIHRLLPGHWLSIRAGSAPVVEQYWSAVQPDAEPLKGEDRAIEAELEALMIDAFKLRMVADVPVGVFLSGGVDSSLVTAILARHHSQRLRTFTIGFSEGSHDESQWARRVAHHCGTDHTEYILDPSEALAITRDWGQLFDEPFGDSSGIPTFLVSRLAREQVKVALSADGGDELFSGYPVYGRVLDRSRRLGRIPQSLRGLAAAAASAVSVARVGRSSTGLGDRVAGLGRAIEKIDRLGRMVSAPTPGRIMDIYASHWHPDQISSLIGPYVSAREDPDCYPGSPSQRISLWDVHHYLPDDILTKVDRTTMAVGLEGREPLLDHRLVEFAFRLPDHLRRGDLGPKHVLKSILYRYVPRDLVDRPKQGFAIPLQRWLRADLKELVDDYLSEARIREGGLMAPTAIRGLLDRFFAGDNGLTDRVWLVLAFEMWRQKWSA